MLKNLILGIHFSNTTIAIIFAFYIKKSINFHSQSKSVDELSVKLRKLMIIC